MKLHLPKMLLSAVLAIVAVPSVTLGDSLSVNFYQNGSGETIANREGSLFGVAADDWNDVLGKENQTQNLTLSTENEQSINLTLKTTKDSWGSPNASGNNGTGTIEEILHASYLDVNGDNHWTIELNCGDWWIKDVTFYMSGDGGLYDPINVNGVNYIGTNESSVNQTGSSDWGNRSLTIDDYSISGNYTDYISDADLNPLNTIRVSSLRGDIVATNAHTDRGRGSLAGMQVVDVTDSIVYSTTLSDDATLANVAWSKSGVDGTIQLGDIAPESRYLSVAAAENGSVLNVSESASIVGLQLAANNLTVTGNAISGVEAIHAKSGTVLTMNAALSGTDLTLSGAGNIELGSLNYTGAISVGAATTVRLNLNTKGWSSFSNSGTVVVNAGSEETYLNNLIGASVGSYKPAFITNTAIGNLIIEHTGNKTLSGDITISNGGTITLKGGTFGTAETPITKPNSFTLNNNTRLKWLDAHIYLSGTNSWQIVSWEIGDGATLHLTTKDTLSWSHAHNLKLLSGGSLDVGSNVQSIGSTATIELAGGTISGAGGATEVGILGLDFHAGSNEGKGILVSENSTISTSIGSHLEDKNVRINVLTDKILTMEGNLAGNTSSGFTKSGDGTLLYKGAAFSNALTVSGGVFEYYMDDDRMHTATISGTGTLKKSGSGTLTVSGTVGAADATLGVLEVTGGTLELSSTTYISEIDMHSGGSLILSGQGITHTISGAIETKDNTSGSLNIQSGAAVVAGSIKNNWGMNGGIVVDGELTVSGTLELAYNSSPQTLSGSGAVTATQLTLGNSGTYTITVDSLSVTKAVIEGASWGDKTVASIEGRITTVSGETTLNSNSELHFNAGTATLTGAVTNAGLININGGSVAMDGGLSGTGVVELNAGTLSLAAGHTNQIAQLNYSGGTLEHSGLEVTNATFSSNTLVNSGSLSLLGTLNITSVSELTAAAPITYTGGTVEGNGYADGGSYYIINGGSITYGDNFKVQLNGTDSGSEAGATHYVTRNSDSLILTLAGQSDIFYVNTGEETMAQDVSSYYVREEACLVASSFTGILNKSISGTGTVHITIGETNNHDNGFTASEFNGVVEIAKADTGRGNTNLTANYTLGEDAMFRLISGNHWSNGGVISRALELAGDEDEHFIFAHINTLEISGKVTGTYLTAGQSYDKYFQTNGNNASDNNLTLNGAGSSIGHVKMTGGRLTVNADMAFGELNAPTVSIGNGINLTIGSNEESASAITRELSAEAGTITLKENTSLTLGGGTESAPYIHTLGGMTQAAGSGLYLGDYATLRFGVPEETSTNASIDQPIVNLVITGGTGSVLELAMGSHYEHTYNNTVKLTAADGVNTTDKVRITAGFLANTAHTGTAATNLGGADLVLADGAGLVVRTNNSVIDFGAGDITLEGSSDLYLYGAITKDNSTITNNISGGTLNLRDDGEVTLSGNINLSALTHGAGDPVALTGETIQIGTATLNSGKGFILGDGDATTLTTATFNTVNVASGTGTITLNSDATLISKGKTGAGTLSLAGSGVFELQSATANVEINNIALTEGWTGTIKASGGDLNQLDLYANENSRLELSGVKAWISNNETLYGTLKLTNAGSTSALSLSDGYSNTPYATFAGAITGTGDMKFIWNGTSSNISAEHTFSGATGEWSGRFISGSGNSNKDVVASFTKSGDVFSSTVEGGGVVNESSRKLTVNIGSTEGDISFHGTISKSQNAGDLELNVTNNTVAFNKSVSVDSLSVANGATACLNNTMKVADVTLSATSQATAEAPATLTGKSDNALAAMADDTSFTISDMTLTNVRISAAEAGTEVKLNNVTASGVELAQGAFTVANQAQVESHSVEGNKVSYTTGLLSGITLANTADGGATLTVDLGDLATVAGLNPGTYDLSITLSGFAMDYTAGTGLKFAADSWLGKLLAEQGGGAYVDSSTLSEPTVAAQAAANTVGVQYSAITDGEGGAHVGTLITITGLNVPEPTTTTLSLLALAGLAARRRRR